MDGDYPKPVVPQGGIKEKCAEATTPSELLEKLKEPNETDGFAERHAGWIPLGNGGYQNRAHRTL